MSVSTDCASAIANKPHTKTSTSRAIVPTNLRARIGIGALRASQLRIQTHDYMVRAAPCKQALMSETVKASEIPLRTVRLWLLTAAAMIFLTLVVGGATRLTESGLSIVEWKPVTGVLPPLSESEWQSEFTKYQAIPQYREINRGMNLDAFKTIYWWEWSHRVLARLTGAVFLLPFLFFLWRGAIPRGLRGRLWAIFIAGGALGVVGPHARRECLAISSCFSPHAGQRDLCSDPVDCAAACTPRFERSAGPVACRRARYRNYAAVADLSWRAG